MNMATCAYCGGDRLEGGRCLGCGGNKTANNEDLPHTDKAEPFFYNGFIVWPIRRGAYGWDWDSIEYHFYLGNELVDIISFTRDLWQNMFPPDNAGQDHMRFVWELFLVRHGDNEAYIVEVAKKNLETYNRASLGRLLIITREKERKETIDKYTNMSYQELLELRDRAYA